MTDTARQEPAPAALPRGVLALGCGFAVLRARPVGSLPLLVANDEGGCQGPHVAFIGRPRVVGILKAGPRS